MTATSGDWLRRAAPAAITIIALGLTACSGSDSEPVDAPSASASATVDQAAADQQAIQKLAKDVWALKQQVYNSGEATSAMFEGLYSVNATELEIGKVNTYKAKKILRTGAPVITAVEATVAGDEGEILLCLNEDGWGAEADGEPIDVDPRGDKPWGAAVERTTDGWVFVEALKTVYVETKKTC